MEELRRIIFLSMSEMYFLAGHEQYSWVSLLYAYCPDLVYFELRATLM